MYKDARTVKYSADPEVAEMQRKANGKLEWVEIINDGEKRGTGVRGFIGRALLAADKVVVRAPAALPPNATGN